MLSLPIDVPRTKNQIYKHIHFTLFNKTFMSVCPIYSCHGVVNLKCSLLSLKETFTKLLIKTGDFQFTRDEK